MSGCFERSSEGSNFVDDATRGPDITLLVILLVVDLLGAHVVGGSHVSVSEYRILVHNPR